MFNPFKPNSARKQVHKSSSRRLAFECLGERILPTAIGPMAHPVTPPTPVGHFAPFSPAIAPAASIANIHTSIVGTYTHVDAPIQMPPVRVGATCGPFDYNSVDRFSFQVPMFPGTANKPLTVDQHGAVDADLSVPLPGAVLWGIDLSASRANTGQGSVQIWGGPFLGTPNCHIYGQIRVFGH